MYNQSDIKILSIDDKYKGFVHVQKLELKHRLFNGKWSPSIHRELVHRGNAAAVFAIDPKTKEVILTQQFRIGAYQSESPWLIDVIAGMVEVDETYEQVAERETLEEVGGRIKIESTIGRYYSTAGACSEKTTLFFGTLDSSELPLTAGCSDENEDIKVVKLSFESFFEYLKTEEVVTSSLMIAGLWLKSYLKNEF